MLSLLMSERMKQKTEQGIMMSMGMDPMRDARGGVHFGFHESNGVFMKSLSNIDTWVQAPPLTLGQAALSVGAPALFTGLGAVGAYKTNGFTGVGQVLASDIATNAAMLDFHYMPAVANGTGPIIKPGLFTGMGGQVSGSVRAMNTASFLGRGFAGGVSGVIGGGIGQAVGSSAGGIFGETGSNIGGFVGGVGGSAAGAYVGVGAASALMTPVGAGLAVGISGIALTLAATAGVVGSAAYGGYKTLEAGYYHQQTRKSIHTSGSLAAFNTSDAQTMRGRAVQAIHKNHLNARSALGQEASYLHFPNRSYQSKYRRSY